MTYKLPPLQCLIAFEALARLRSGTLAAQELFVTPSAVTHRIRQLETSMGIELFNSAQGNFTLTAKGAEYLEVVKEALGALSHYSLRSRTSVSARRLRVTVPPTFGRQILMPHLSNFEEEHPDIHLTLQLSVPLIGLKAEESDVEIRFGKGDYAGVESVRILDEPVFPVCSPAYLKDYGPFDHPENLAGARLLLCPLEPWRPWLKAAKLDWPEPNAGPQFVDIGLMQEAAVLGYGIGLGRQSFVRAWIDSGALLSLFDLRVPSLYSYYLVYPSATNMSQESKIFIQWMLNVFAAPTA